MRVPRCRHHRKLIAPGGAAAASIDHRPHVPIQYNTHSPNLAPFLGSSSQERGAWISAKSGACFHSFGSTGSKAPGMGLLDLA